MKHAERRHERTVGAVVIAIFAALWLIAFALGEPPESPSRYLVSAAVVAVVAAPWVIAARLVWRAASARLAIRLADLDGPARLLEAAAAAAPADRREWTAAMAAELGQVPGRSARWWFAAGCASAAVFPPRSGRIPLLALAVLAAAATLITARAVDHALPAMRVFATTFVAVVGGLATLAAARSRRLRQAAPEPAIAIAGVAGVAVCIALTAWFLLEHPAAAEHLTPPAAVLLALALAVCLWLALLPPRVLAGRGPGRVVGGGAALLLGLGFLATSRWTIDTPGGTFIWVLLAPALVTFSGSTAAAAGARSLRAGIQAGVWTQLVGTLLVFAISLPESMRRYEIDARTLGDGELGCAIGVNLFDAVRVLFAMPLLGLPFSVIGAVVGSRSRRERGTALPLS